MLGNKVRGTELMQKSIENLTELKTPVDPKMKSTNSTPGEAVHSSRPKRNNEVRDANSIKIEKVDPKASKISPTKTR